MVLDMKLMRVGAVVCLLAVGMKAQVASTPPMGWNSWDAYGLTITEPQFRANVDVLKTKLLPFGWNYAVIDEGWYFENPQDRERPDTLRYAIDANGRYVPVPERFPTAGAGVGPDHVRSAAGSDYKLEAVVEPTSFRALGMWVHSQGLKFGIHIIRGIPKVSTERNLPIEGGGFHAKDAADTTDTCPWDPTNWGVKDNAAGQAWYDSLIRQYASWSVDLLKVDCIGDHPYKVDEIRMIRRAIDKVGRPMVLSLSPGPMNLEHAEEVGTLANMWRISDDEWDVWDAPGKGWPQTVKSQFARLAAWEKFAKPGTWPDADMLAIGELRPFPGWGKARTTGLNAEEQKTLLTLWAMGRSPLILGANLTMLDDATLKLLTNKDLIAIDQTAVKSEQFNLMAHGAQANDVAMWRAEMPHGEVAYAFFNLGDAKVGMNQNDGDLTGGKLVRDVWEGKELGTKMGLEMMSPPHGCKLFVLH
jgi:alpha-galactosidase